MMKVTLGVFLALQVATSSAFMVSPATTSSRSGSSIGLNVINGAAKDAEEDLRLTLKIIMDHAERSATASKKKSSDSQPTESNNKVDKVPVKAEPTQTTESQNKVKKSPKAAEPKPKIRAAEAAEPTPKETPKIEINRQFRFVADDETGFKITDGKPSISCDGRIPGGATLELTHWTDNETPDELYADTSTEMALKLAQHSEYAEAMKDAWILNNHYDTDGVLSVWACLEPEKALEYSDLLIQGAEAGDFGEWSSDEGVKLDCALTKLRSNFDGDGLAFVIVLKDHLSDLLEDLQSTGGKAHAHLWGPGFTRAVASWESLQENKAKFEVYNEDIVIVSRPWSVPAISPYALHRKLKEEGLDLSTKRVLQVLTDAKGARFKYEKVGHGWVQKLIQRPSVPSVNAKKLVEDLNADYEGSNWKEGGEGLVAICQSINITSTPVHELAEYLAKHDDGL